jgi:co-chaperonin GroES (HSP10)
MIDLRCLRLLSDLVMVRVEPGGRFENGLFIPAECQVKHEDAGRIHLITRAGEVVAMGPGKRAKKTGVRIPMDVSVGDRVWFSGWTGQRPQGVPEPTPWGEDTLVMHESELLAAPKEAA